MSSIIISTFLYDTIPPDAIVIHDTRTLYTCTYTDVVYTLRIGTEIIDSFGYSEWNPQWPGRGDNTRFRGAHRGDGPFGRVFNYQSYFSRFLLHGAVAVSGVRKTTIYELRRCPSVWEANRQNQKKIEKLSNDGVRIAANTWRWIYVVSFRLDISLY